MGSIRIRAHLTEGVHPQVIAISHNAGRRHGGPIATNGKDRIKQPGNATSTDPDQGRIWWAGSLSVAQNTIMPIYPDPVSGQQAYHDTVVKVRRV